MILGLEIGSWADWASGLGSFGAIVFVYIQIRQQGKQHYENHHYNFTIAIGERRIRQKSNGRVTFSAEREFVFWGTNDGNAPGSFRYLGLCTSNDFDVINRDRKKNIISDTEKNIEDLDPLYAFGLYERLDPGCISTEITLPISSVRMNFKDNENVCVVYMDPLGKFYKRELVVPTDN